MVYFYQLLIPFKNVLLQQSAYCLKVVFTTILLLCFLSLKESICETKKNVFYFTAKVFPFSRKSKFRTLDIQTS